ncbi:hypothetical protein EW026_g5601 [Hermanssonia centrifuga]|uniref:RanBP2-type domain-containing protein n=1 Tax=Hermanssonia centrifuga TaxID=98765 RepID=A0A4S4KDV5_9APHY|nr:hypothetical protein EW026_g5601 [Hermanssonia centrifuga]
MSRNASPSRGLHISSAPQSPIGPLKAPAPSYPLLTPSGHALSAGGRVRNISHDPLCPCIMYWPDNEPLPDRGQIRPLGSAVIQYPPIVNTGNKGAAEKQPGDWVCLTCNYLNWRRRKVCQTCYPYAEGNGDSISQAVQAERIALLTNVLNQVEPPSHLTRRASVPVQNNQVFPPQSVIHANPAVQSSVGPLGYRTAGRSRSQMDLRTQYQDSRPIYQTPVYNRRGISPHSRVPSPTSALLPSCLQEIIQSPMHSSPATSSSSADLSFEDYDLSFELADQMLRQAQGARVYSTSSPAVSGSIWKLDGEETKTLKFSGPPTQNDFVMDLAGRMAAGLSLITN